MNLPNLTSHKLAELVGIILGDGSINIYKKNNHYRLKISGHSIDDKLYHDYISLLFEELFEVTPIRKNRINEQTTNTFIFKRDIINFFVDVLGMKTSPKWKRALIPPSFLRSDLELNVLKGYFDTDGSVVLTKNGKNTLYPRLEMKISPSPMQQQFIAILKRNGFNLTISPKPNGNNLVRIQMNGIKPLLKWHKIVGFSNPKHKEKAIIALNNSKLKQSF